MVTMFLGGSASPIGWCVQYVDAPFDVFLAELVRWRQISLAQQVEVSDPQPFPQVLGAFVPFQSPWTRELVLPCGSWTAYLNNSINGGDPTASAVVIADRLKARWVMGQHCPPYGPGHQATQLWVTDPGGRERSLAAYAEDGRWGWEESGQPFPFEDLDRYSARRKRNRFDRVMLLRYLEALGIAAADDSAHGDGVIVQQRAAWQNERPSRVVSLADARAELRSR